MTAIEKEELYTIIEAMFGYDSMIASAKHRFNERTVSATEEALAALIECNENMKGLLIDLVGGAKFLAKGWLKKGLSNASRLLKYKKAELNGAACRNQTKARWRNAILLSAMPG